MEVRVWTCLQVLLHLDSSYKVRREGGKKKKKTSSLERGLHGGMADTIHQAKLLVNEAVAQSR